MDESECGKGHTVEVHSVAWGKGDQNLLWLWMIRVVVWNVASGEKV